jgi:putative hydrolase of the HAD superfamily
MPGANGEASDLLDIIRRHTTSLEPIPTSVEPSGSVGRGEIRTVIFDVYGTLLVSGSGDVGTAQETVGSDPFIRALSSFGEKHRVRNTPAAGEVAREGYFEEIASEHTAKIEGGTDYPEVEIREIWRKVWIRLGDSGLVEEGPLTETSIEELALYYELFSNPTYPMPGSRETVERLRDAGVRLGIVSNAQFFTHLLFPGQMGGSTEELGFDSELLVWSFKEGVAKPSPDIFRRLLDRAGDLDPSTALYVGNDMLNDIAAAASCGFKTCLFAGDRRSLRLRSDEERCAGVVPDLRITSLDQIPDGIKVT